ncbi:hypothetical protein OT109_03040 [Phycisphaeraceae bacterium D3-23]
MAAYLDMQYAEVEGPVVIHCADFADGIRLNHAEISGDLDLRGSTLGPTSGMEQVDHTRDRQWAVEPRFKKLVDEEKKVLGELAALRQAVKNDVTQLCILRPSIPSSRKGFLRYQLLSFFGHKRQQQLAGVWAAINQADATRIEVAKRSKRIAQCEDRLHRVRNIASRIELRLRGGSGRQTPAEYEIGSWGYHAVQTRYHAKPDRIPNRLHRAGIVDEDDIVIAIDLRLARIHGHVMLADARFHGSFIAEDVEVRGEVDFLGTRIAGHLSMRSAKVDGRVFGADAAGVHFEYAEECPYPQVGGVIDIREAQLSDVYINLVPAPQKTKGPQANRPSSLTPSEVLMDHARVGRIQIAGKMKCGSAHSKRRVQPLTYDQDGNIIPGKVDVAVETCFSMHGLRFEEFDVRDLKMDIKSVVSSGRKFRELLFCSALAAAFIAIVFYQYYHSAFTKSSVFGVILLFIVTGYAALQCWVRPERFSFNDLFRQVLWSGLCWVAVTVLLARDPSFWAWFVVAYVALSFAMYLIDPAQAWLFNRFRSLVIGVPLDFRQAGRYRLRNNQGGDALTEYEVRGQLLRFLEHMTVFSRDNYLTVERWLRSRGDDILADEVFLSRRRRETREQPLGGQDPTKIELSKPSNASHLPLLVMVWRKGLDLFVGYGVRPSRPFHLFILLFLINFGVFLNPYSMERPLVNIGTTGEPHSSTLFYRDGKTALNWQDDAMHIPLEGRPRQGGPSEAEQSEPAEESELAEQSEQAQQLAQGDSGLSYTIDNLPSNPWLEDGGMPSRSEWDTSQAFFSALRVQIPVLYLVVDTEWVPASREIKGFPVIGIKYENYAAGMMAVNFALIPVLLAGAFGVLKQKN